jgi:hypothetical protein
MTAQHDMDDRVESPIEDPIEWQPATSKPGELYTPEGQIASYGAAARGLVDKDPRRAAYKRQMLRTGLLVAAGGSVLAAIAGVIVAAVS